MISTPLLAVAAGVVQSAGSRAAEEKTPTAITPLPPPPVAAGPVSSALAGSDEVLSSRTCDATVIGESIGCGEGREQGVGETGGREGPVSGGGGAGPS